MEVLYGVGTDRFIEFIQFEGENTFLLRNTALWWKHRGGEFPLPTTTEEAVERAHHELRLPTVIRVNVAEKYPKVVGCDFNEDAKISDDTDEIIVDKPYCESQPPSKDEFVDDDDIPF